MDFIGDLIEGTSIPRDAEPGDVRWIGQGYYPDGNGRPMRRATLLTKAGRMGRWRYHDSGEVITCPVCGLATTRTKIPIQEVVILDGEFPEGFTLPDDRLWHSKEGARELLGRIQRDSFTGCKVWYRITWLDGTSYSGRLYLTLDAVHPCIVDEARRAIRGMIEHMKERGEFVPGFPSKSMKPKDVDTFRHIWQHCAFE